MEAEEYKNEYVSVICKSINYKEACAIYNDSNVNVVFVKESDGIYGLTSILDSFNCDIPILVNKTDGIAIDVEKVGIGKEVDLKDINRIASELIAMQNTSVLNKFKKSILKQNKTFNMHVFSRAVCDELKAVAGL